VSKDQKERPEDSIANEPMIKYCFPRVQKIVSQKTSIKRNRENSIHFLCAIEAEKVRKGKANVPGFAG
jgi:hypothetical protein